MAGWPPFDDPRLASRLAMDEGPFRQLALKLARRVDGRSFLASDFEHAIGYPWARPEGSFLLVGGQARALRAEDWQRLRAEDRHPLIAFGSNCSPATLERKFRSLKGSDRELPVLVGTLDGFALKHSAHLAIYGALPATIVRAGNASCPAALSLLTSKQFALIARTELNYRLVRLEASAFAPALDLQLSDSLFAWVSRHGAFLPEVAFSDQRAVLDRAAQLVLGAGGSAQELVRRTIESYAWAVEVAEPLLAEHAAAFEPGDWNCFSNRRAERSL